MRHCHQWLRALRIAFTCLAACLFVSTVHAQDFTKRVYINGGFGLTHIEPESPSNSFEITEDSDAGFHLGLGVDLSRLITLEIYGADLGTSDVDFLGTSAGTIDYQVFGISALAYLLNSRSGFVPGDDDTNGAFRREGASLYGRLGWGHLRNSAQGVSFDRVHPNHAAFGVGVEYGFSNGIALRTELMSFDTDAQYWNVGILKRFGKVDATPVAAAALPAVAAIAEPQSKAVPEEPIMFKAVSPPYIYFDVDDSVLSQESNEKLDEFAAAVMDHDTEFHIEGHTDWIAPEAYNMSLSVRRAEAVANYLVGQGIDRGRIRTVGYGETRPISANNTEEGRALNRRSEIKIR